MRGQSRSQRRVVGSKWADWITWSWRRWNRHQRMLRDKAYERWIDAVSPWTAKTNDPDKKYVKL